MIPYFQIPPLHIVGSYALQPFGTLVVTGILLGAWMAQRRAREHGIERSEMSNTVFSAVAPGLLGARVFDYLFYGTGPLLSLGLSSYGGFLGALIGMTVYFTWFNRKAWLEYADIIVQSLVLGWIFGRLGCTVAHDHPGYLTDFFLAVQYPGGARHNLGLYEFVYTLVVLFPATLWLNAYERKKGYHLGLHVGAASLLYGPVRFVLDMMRSTDQVASDERYWGLTPAQYASLALTVYGAVMLSRALKRGPVRPARAKRA